MSIENQKHIIITIDGPAGSGKSSIAKTLAQNLNFYYLATGLLYRSLAYILINLEKKLDLPITKENVAALANDHFLCIKYIDYVWTNNKAIINYQGKDITSFLQNRTIEQAVSLISAHPAARKAMLILQQKIASMHSLITEGRDCGSIVFPNATIKFYLTANVDKRAERIYNDPQRTHGTATLEEIKQDLIKRDQQDQTRTLAPLVIPHNAIVIDNSDITFQQTIDLFKKNIHDSI